MDRPPEENLPHPLAKLAEWKQYSRMPIGMRNAHAVVLGDKIYLGGGAGPEGPLSKLLIYDFSNDSWDSLNTPTQSYSLAVYRSQLLLVGGVDPTYNIVSKQLWVLDEKHWKPSSLPSMLIERFGASVVSVGDHLIIAGGDKGGMFGRLDVVDVFDGQQWRRVQSLPKTCSRMKSVVHEGFWFLAGGVDQGNTIFYTSLKSLIATTHSEGDEPEQVWKTLPDAPFQCSTPVIFGKHLTAIGGLFTSAIHVYSHQNKTWVRVGELPVAYSFFCCLVLPKTGELLLAGGKSRHGISAHVYSTKIQVPSFSLDDWNLKLTISALDRLEAVGNISLFNQLTPELLAAMGSTLHLDKSDWKNPRQLFEDWLSSQKCSLPPTWDSLLQVLHSPIAKEIKDFFTTPGNNPSLAASLELQQKLMEGRQQSTSTETNKQQTKPGHQQFSVLPAPTLEPLNLTTLAREWQENLLYPLAKLAEWKEYSRMPIGMRNAHAVVLGDKMYLGGGDEPDGPSSKLLIYDFTKDSWDILDTPTQSYSLAVYRSKLVLVGGVDPTHNTVMSKLWVLDEKRCWTNPLPPMPMERFGASVVSDGNHLIVAGGHKGGTLGLLDVVDVYDGQQWRRVQSLPKTCSRMKSVVHEGFWYLTGGVGRDQKVYYTSLKSLIATAHSAVVGDEPEVVWKTLPDAPFQYCTPVILGKQLTTVGGSHMSAIYVYSHHIKTWLYVGDLPVACSFVSLVLPTTGELLMIGGKSHQETSLHVFRTNIQVTSFPDGNLTISALDLLDAVGNISFFKQLTPNLLSVMASALHLDKSNWANPRLLFENWLSSCKSFLPPTWDSLLRVLLSIHSPLAEEIKDFFATPGEIPSLAASLELQQKLKEDKQQSTSTESDKQQTKPGHQQFSVLPAPTITKLEPLNSTTLTLEWQSPTIELSTLDAIRSWEVQYEVVGSEGRRTVEMVDPDTTALNLTVDRGTHYCVRVAGWNQEGRGSWSSDLMAETPVDPPSMPKNLTVKGVVGELALKTSWDAPSDNGGRPVVSYTVQIREISENEAATNFIALTPLPVINASEVQFTYNIRDSHNFHLTKNTVYEVQVVANNVAGPGLSSTARASTVDKAALETALKKESLMPLCIAQCMTVGVPQTGKSSLKRRLLKQIGQPNKSTGVADKPVVSAVTAEGSEWTVLEWEDEGARFLQTLDQPPSKKPSEFPTSPSGTSDMPEHTEMLQGSHFPVGLPQREEPAQETAMSVGISTDSIPHSVSCNADMELSINQNEPEPSSYSDLIDTILDVDTEKWIAAKKRLENQCTIYFTDTGGQLEFQEVLPAIISGPSIFFLVFNLEHAAKGLDVEFPAVYKRSDGQVYEPPSGISTFTIRDSILHILSSIQTTRCYNFKKDDKNRLIEAKVLLVGTHSDCVTDASVRKEIERDVQKLLKDTPYYQNGMLVVPCRKQPNERFVYMVNNKSSEDQVFQEIREKVRSLIFQKSGDSDYKEDISAQWLGFDLMLRWPNKSKILTFKHCSDLAHRCGIKEDNVEKALTFLHERFGIIRYFKGKGLGDIVITNPQVIYNMLSDLIAEKFNDSDGSLTPKQVKEFQNKGIISESAIERITAQRGETPDLLAFLLNLLSHLHIVVKLEADEENPETKYFMPCVLAGTIQDLSASEERSEPRVADLLIVFDAGEEYCPKGLFSVLVIKLAQKPKPQKYKWVLNRKQLGRERVVFQIILYAKDLFCTYTVHIQHGLVRSRSVLRIFVEKLDRTGVHLSPENLGSVCKEIRDSVQSVIKSSLEELHKLTKFNVGFYSTCEKNQTSHKSHIGIMCIKDLCQRPYSVPQDMTCIDCDNVVCSLKEEHKVWFSEVPQVLEPRPQVLPAPTITKLEPLNSTTLTLEWQPPAIELSTLDAICSWEVQYEVVGSEGRQTVEMVDPDTTALNLTVDRGTHYCVRVAGWNREGRGSWSSDMLAETPVDGTKPTLPELLSFTCTDGRVVSIPAEIAINYVQFGIFLLDDKNGSRVDNLKHKNNDAVLINIAILQEWLNGKGKQPVTWKTLVKALKDIKLCTLADDISASKCPSEQ